VRTTLNIDDDVLIAVKEVAKHESISTGAIASRLLRESLAGIAHGQSGDLSTPVMTEFGFRPFPKRGGIVTNAMIDRLREEIGDE